MLQNWAGNNKANLYWCGVLLAKLLLYTFRVSNEWKVVFCETKWKWIPKVNLPLEYWVYFYHHLKERERKRTIESILIFSSVFFSSSNNHSIHVECSIWTSLSVHIKNIDRQVPQERCCDRQDLSFNGCGWLEGCLANKLNILII